MSVSFRHDEDLMAEVARGDASRVEPLLRRHAGPLLTFIRRMVGDAHLSEDLFQDVFLSVWLNRARYQYPRPFRPWLYTIAANKCRAWLRWRQAGRRVRERLEQEAIAARPPDIVDPAVASETSERVEAAVRTLPERQREVVVLRVWSGLSYDAIAAITGKRVGTVRSLMFHALAALRREMGAREPDRSRP